jgi:DNA/RNA-binding domain of Phe-tRNA-synthetase-like protein
VLIRVAPDLTSIVRLGVLTLDSAVNASNEERLDAPLADAEDAARRSPPPESQAVRAMYRRIGLDPTKTRPSSEALLRRVRKGDHLPRINALVDICNWCSLEFQLPYGLYDLSAIEPPIDLRIGMDGEEYEGIRKDVVHVAGRMTLADAHGPFGNPTSDSARSMVTTSTASALCTIFAPGELPAARIDEILATTARRFHDFTGAIETWRGVI